MELKEDKYKDLLRKKVDLFADLNGVLDHNGSTYFSRDWIADLLGFNRNIIRKEKINKIYE
jgi:hypothetical protein